MSQTIVDLIRHGEPIGGSLYRGHSIDDPLSEIGWQQMWQAVGNYSQWQSIVSSPLLRCRVFAEQLAAKYDIPIQIEPDFKEVGFGSWEGLTRAQVKQNNLQEYLDFYNDPVNKRPAGCEDLNVFIQRVISSYEKIVEQYKGQHILVVAHAGVIRAILAHIVYAPPKGIYNFKIENAGISRIHAQNNQIVFINNSLNQSML